MNCYDYAINYIYRFPKSEHELKAKLLQKWYFSDEVNNTLEKLKTKWYVDDKMFAESYIRSEIINKWKPVIRVMRKLYDKWINQDLVKSVLMEFGEEVNEWLNEKIKKEIESYKRKWVEGFDIIQKLLRKWYKLDDIKNVINSTAKKNKNQ